MHRLFVAIRPPRAIRERLLAMMGGVPLARWQDDDQLHLTLRFIGEVDRHCAEDIAAALGTVRQPRFALGLSGVGRFDRQGRIEALWVGVAPHAPLKALHRKIDQTIVRTGLPPEGRAYMPHITLARFPRHNATSAPVTLPAAALAGGDCEISEFCLYESELGGSGATYSKVARYPLV